MKALTSMKPTNSAGCRLYSKKWPFFSDKIVLQYPASLRRAYRKAKSLKMVAAGLATLATGVSELRAQNIGVPNFSFESQSAVGFPFDTNPNVEAWRKIPEPAYYTPSFGSFGIPWEGTAGVFVDSNPYANHVGTQAGYILAAPQVTLYQDYESSIGHDFNATFEVGMSYALTIGIYGKSSIAPDSTLKLSLYYRDGPDNQVAVGSTTVTYSAAAFPAGDTLNLIDYQVTVPSVQAGDAWAGKHIGIKLESTVPIETTSFGNWDFDNVRLVAVPEPATASLMALGFGGWLLAQSRSQRK
jgi:hypothetical protein